jgi:Homeodomain-like domain
VADVRHASRTSPSTCRKIKYSNRSDTPGSCPTSDHRSQRPTPDFWHPTGPASTRSGPDPPRHRPPRHRPPLRVYAAEEGFGRDAPPGIRKWRNRFVMQRLDGLLDDLGPAGPRTISDAQVEQVITQTLEATPKDATHWSTRSLAAQVGLNQTAVSRI